MQCLGPQQGSGGSDLPLKAIAQKLRTCVGPWGLEATGDGCGIQAPPPPRSEEHPPKIIVAGNHQQPQRAVLERKEAAG